MMQYWKTFSWFLLIFWGFQVLWLSSEEKDHEPLQKYITEMLKVEKGETLLELGADSAAGTVFHMLKSKRTQVPRGISNFLCL